MVTNYKPSELGPRMEGLSISSAAGTTSRQYDMQGYDQAFIGASIKGNFTTVTMDLMESSVATAGGTSAAGSKAGMVLGGVSTLISTAGGCAAMTITITTATTDADYFSLTVGGVRKRFNNSDSTAYYNSSAWTSTNLYFGSTVGSTADTGMQTRCDSLKTAIESSKGFADALIVTTATTATLAVVASDNAAGPIAFSATGADITAAVNEVAGGFNIRAGDLDSTANKRYVSLKISSAATSGSVGVTVIRTAGSYKPVGVIGKVST